MSAALVRPARGGRPSPLPARGGARSPGTAAAARRAAWACTAGLLLQAPAFAQDPSLPAGEGRDLVVAQCASCHPLSTAVIKRASQEEWAATVARMVTTYLAPIAAADTATIVSYLATHYGEDAGSSDPGRELLAEQCFGCHGEGMWSDLETDRRGWESVLYRMIGRGALWTTDQVAVMADYLTETYPAGGGG
jgi:mono/diheme cytochrome c family protein